MLVLEGFELQLTVIVVTFEELLVEVDLLVISLEGKVVETVDKWGKALKIFVGPYFYKYSLTSFVSKTSFGWASKSSKHSIVEDKHHKMHKIAMKGIEPYLVGVVAKAFLVHLENMVQLSHCFLSRQLGVSTMRGSFLNHDYLHK
jgi:hypothetical protein